MTETRDTIECPCYRVCAALGLELKPWCRYRSHQVPPPGMRKFDPKQQWCPAGVQAAVLMLAYLIEKQAGPDVGLAPALEGVRLWMRDHAQAPVE
jgi:hypothetical protein